MRHDDTHDEILMGRVLDGSTSAADWSTLEHAAASDPLVWRRLALSALAECDLLRATRPQLARAERVELPTQAANAGPPRGVLRRVESAPGEAPEVGFADRRESGKSAPMSGRSGLRGNSRVPNRLGWAAAALVAGAWLLTLAAGSPRELPSKSAHPQLARETMTADEALEQYRTAGLREGRLVAELPRLVMATQVDEDTESVEVYAVRRFVERTEVDQLYRLAQDDAGSLHTIPVSTAVLQEGSL